MSEKDKWWNEQTHLYCVLVNKLTKQQQMATGLFHNTIYMFHGAHVFKCAVNSF